MRIFITDTETTPQTLNEALVRRPGSPSTTLERVIALNPQVKDFSKLPAGTVLILPDASDLKADAGAPIAGSGMDDVVADMGRGITAVGSRVGNRVEQLQADHAAVTAALKTAAAKRLVESDPELEKRVKAAELNFKAEQKAAAETQEQLKDVQKSALAEFEKLQKMLAR
jgi:hypothetical protein